jgi:hypothetical protein
MAARLASWVGTSSGPSESHRRQPRNNDKSPGTTFDFSLRDPVVYSLPRSFFALDWNSGRVQRRGKHVAARASRAAVAPTRDSWAWRASKLRVTNRLTHEGILVHRVGCEKSIEPESSIFRVIAIGRERKTPVKDGSSGTRQGRGDGWRSNLGTGVRVFGRDNYPSTVQREVLGIGGNRAVRMPRCKDCSRWWRVNSAWCWRRDTIVG